MIVQMPAILPSAPCGLQRVGGGKAVGAGGQQGVGLFDAAPQQGVGGAGLGRGGGDLEFHDLHAGEQGFDLLEIQPPRRILRRPLQVGDGRHAVIQAFDLGAVGVVFLCLVGKEGTQFAVGPILRALHAKGFGQSV